MLTISFYPAFIIYAKEENDPKGEKVLYLSDLLHDYGIDCQIDQYHSSSGMVTDWSHWVSQSIKHCIHLNGYILLVCSPAMLAALEDTVDNIRVNMAVSHIDRLTLRQLLNDHTAKFLPLCIDDTSTNYIPLNLKGKIVYHFPFNKLPENATPQQLLEHPDFTSLRTLVATLTGQQQIPPPIVAPHSKLCDYYYVQYT